MNIGINTVYYLPGAGGRINNGLGNELMERGFSVTGRETRDAFRSLRFSEQIQIIKNDLEIHFCHQSARVICNSYGAYLFLHAQSNMAPFGGRVLLLSPIVGEFASDQFSTGFSPPHPERLKDLARAGEFPAPTRCEIHVGADDWQSIPENVTTFGMLTGIPVNVIPNKGHDLGKDCVGKLLDRWLL
jgi:hypothetical protein